MKYNISKELFEAVRNYKINKISIYGSSKYFYIFDDYLPEHNKIGRAESFNDFFFDCKDWAMGKGYQIISGLSDEPACRKQDEKAYAKINYYAEDKIGNREYKDTYIMGNTEVEAVIKASEYVLAESHKMLNILEKHFGIPNLHKK